MWRCGLVAACASRGYTVTTWAVPASRPTSAASWSARCGTATRVWRDTLAEWQHANRSHIHRAAHRPEPRRRVGLRRAVLPAGAGPVHQRRYHCSERWKFSITQSLHIRPKFAASRNRSLRSCRLCCQQWCVLEQRVDVEKPMV